MPVQIQTPDPGEIAVRPSAVFELMWLFHICEAEHPLPHRFATQEALRRRFGNSLIEFWDDGVRGFTEVIVLGKDSGTLFDLGLDRFLERLDTATASTGRSPSLLSESLEEQKALRARLARLRSDVRLRRRYSDLLQAVWKAVVGDWEAAGRSAALTEAARWSRRLRDGDTYMEVLGRSRLWKSRPDFDAMVDTAAAEGRLVLSPGWFFGDIHVVELDGDWYLGRGVHLPTDEGEVRKVAVEVASSVKPLADPTRVAILLRLAQQPASVTELARHFKLSQPTVSAHVQVLREAGLIDETPAGRSAKLSANENGLRRLLSNAQESMVQMFRE